MKADKLRFFLKKIFGKYVLKKFSYMEVLIILNSKNIHTYMVTRIMI